MRRSIFISHQSSEAEVAEMVKDFLISTGVPNDRVFCTSVPGNDVKECISLEVKKQFQGTKLVILILSQNYYNSAYCLNEAGIAWYLHPKVKSVAICLPEIDEKNMSGFFNGDNKIRRLCSTTDISAIYDIVRKYIDVPNADHGVVTREQERLKTQYEIFLKSRPSEKQELVKKSKIDIRKNFYYSESDGVMPGVVPIEASFLLTYAADGNGYIFIPHSRDGSFKIFVSGNQINLLETQREFLLWVDALVLLTEFGWVKKCIGIENTYELTKAGYDNAGRIKGGTGINTDNNPLDEIKKNRKNLT